MFLTEVVIDGFKSYSQRTVVSGWDHEFNAITGLNGSGKSNILDAICFVLGITNLTQVRAASLQDLIYKQGQAGVTKATVTLVFNNSDPKTSPVGQELCETISVTRQIVMGGRNKYTINGHTVDASRVQDMFQSVGLNVNNPHFLIMQGRITKVLNMKPPEILGLIEEAAGTRMFEAKKQAAQKTIEKKQVKVEELGKVLELEITPQLKKLQEERANYLRWAANNTEVERLAKFCVAWDYTQAGRTQAAAGARCAELAAAAARHRAAAGEERAAAARKGAEWSAAADRVAAARGGEMAALTDAASASAKDLAAATSRHKNTVLATAGEEKGRAAAAASAGECERAGAALAAALQRHQKASASASASAASLGEQVKALLAKRSAVAAGLREEGASGAGSSGASAADELLASRGKCKTLAAELAGREASLKQLKGGRAEAAGALKAAEKLAAGLTAGVDKAGRVLEGKRAALGALKFDSRGAEAAAARRDSLVSQCGALAEAVDDAARELASAIDFRYDVGAMGKGWDRGGVRGTVASLVRLVRGEAARALEAVAGARLFSVVVDTEHTGRAVLDKGGLKRRCEMIPLNKITGRVLDSARCEAAAAISGGRAVLALHCLAPPPPELATTYAYIFGSTFVCDTPEVARAVCFDKRVNARCVTLDGDVYDPRGILEGGSGAGAGAGGAAASGKAPLLTRVEAAAVLREQLAAAQAALGECEAAISASASAARAAARAGEECEAAALELAGLQERLSASALGGCSARCAALEAEVSGEEAAVGALRGALSAAEASVRALEEETRNAAKARAERLAGVDEALARAKKAAAGAEGEARAAMEAAEAAACEQEGALEEGKAARAALAARAEAVARAAGEEEAARAGVEAASAAAAAAKSALAAAKEALSAADKDVKRLLGERDAAVGRAEEAEEAGRACEAEAVGVKKSGAAAERAERELAAAHPWIAAERPYFDKAHSDYDFGRNDPAKAAARLSELEKQQHELERKINKKVMGMIDGVEREYNDLRTKKHIIENDKAKIEKVMAELDEKKNEALRTTWAKVNKNFGSIFSTLLPGVHAKLEATESGNVLDGLVVRVSFNGVWKESLTELSGGQRSLLALSLILSLLLFKPAPMYILDEVDAALDLSHTQNIGHMIRTHFSHSQFIVVSLKQGMFSNANVIFRTKFVEGTSTVLRTVPAGSTLLGGAGGGRTTGLIKGGEGEEEEEGGAAGGSKGGSGAQKAKAGGGLVGGGGSSSSSSRGGL